MSSFRKHLVFVIGVLAFGAVIYQSWYGGVRTLKKAQASSTAKAADLITANLEERVFELQTKILLGAYFLVKDNPMLQDGGGDVREGFIGDLEKEMNRALENTPDSRASFIIKMLLVSRHYKMDALAEKLEKRLGDFAADDESANLIPLLLDLDLGQDSEEEAAESPEEITEKLSDKFGWFGYFYALDNISEAEVVEGYQERIYSSAKSTMFAAIGVGFAILILGFISFVLTAAVFWRLSCKKFKFRYTSSGAGEAAYCFEIFTLYLVVMLLVPYVVSFFAKSGTTQVKLLLNMLCILSLTALVCWPLASGRTFSSVRHTLGLRSASLRDFFADVYLAPLAYLTSLFSLFVVLLVYALLMSFFEVNISSGAHPIVPILLSEGGEGSALIILVFAVVVAPIVEEIMFRGALYTWLRARWGMVSAIFLSGFIFAVVHPQGAVGLVPLTFIGCTLAFLREWRGSLFTPMVAHGCFNGGTLLLIYLLF